MTLFRPFRLFTLLAALLITAGSVQASRWTWKLDNDRYKRLNVFERAQYDKASKLFSEQNYAAAASEFEKFKIQFPDSDLLPYVVFMIGYSQHESKHRNAAIKTYNEVLDYFGDVIEDAAPALYFLGMAHIENGDVKKGMVLLKEMIDDEDYQKHPLAAGALRRLADNEWKNKNPQAAIRYWKQVVRDFDTTNPDETRVARNAITSYYIKAQDYTAYEDWLVNDENREDPKAREWIAQNAWDLAYGNFHTDWDKYTNFNRDQRTADMAAFYKWFVPQKDWYVKNNDEWRYWSDRLLFVAHRMGDRVETKKVLDVVVPMSKEIKDEKQRNDRFSWLSDRLREAQDWDQALFCVSHISDPPYATFKEYEVLGGKGNWAAAVKKLQDVQAMGNADWANKALSTEAYVTLYYLHQYERAISLYTQLNNPPANLWQIQEAYKRWGKLKEALGTLSEIEGSFPDDAANAAWYKTRYYDEAGDQKNAIANARRIMKVYPQSQASSNAHQLLEKYGIDTGGGVAD